MNNDDEIVNNIGNEVDKKDERINDIEDKIDDKALTVGKILYDISNLKFNKSISILLVVGGILCPFTPILFLFRKDLIIEMGFWQCIFISVLANFISLIGLYITQNMMRMSTTLKTYYKAKLLLIRHKRIIIKFNREIDNLNKELDKVTHDPEIKNERIRRKAKKIRRKITKVEKQQTVYGERLDKIIKSDENISNKLIVNAIYINLLLGSVAFINKAWSYIDVSYPYISKFVELKVNYIDTVVSPIYVYVLIYIFCMLKIFIYYFYKIRYHIKNKVPKTNKVLKNNNISA